MDFNKKQNFFLEFHIQIQQRYLSNIIYSNLNSHHMSEYDKQLILNWKATRYFSGGEELDLNIHEMFIFYNSYFFENVLQKSLVEWSKKMTMCAGTCTHSGPGFCTIRLSEPLLKFRTANQLKQTLLHEMIHGYMFLTNPSACLKEEGHGKQFKEMMGNINRITGLHITVFHNFHDQVRFYQKHVWRCNGKCKQEKPFYGYVRRAVNRPPQKADPWFREHQRKCGGQFIKIEEPEKISKDQKTKSTQVVKKTKNDKVVPFSGKGITLNDYFNKQGQKKLKNQNQFIPFKGEGIAIGGTLPVGLLVEDKKSQLFKNYQ